MWAGVARILLARRCRAARAGRTRRSAASSCRCSCMTAVYFLLNSGLTAVAIGLDTRQSPIRHLAQALSVAVAQLPGGGSVAFCLIVLIQQVSLVAAAMVVLPLLIIFHLTLRAIVRPARGRPAAPRRHGSPVPVDRRDARDGDRRQGRRDAQSRAARAGVRDGAGERTGRRRRAGCSRPSRRPRCCTTRASWPCPNTSSTSRASSAKRNSNR